MTSIMRNLRRRWRAFIAWPVAALLIVGNMAFIISPYWWSEFVGPKTILTDATIGIDQHAPVDAVGLHLGSAWPPVAEAEAISPVAHIHLRFPNTEDIFRRRVDDIVMLLRIRSYPENEIICEGRHPLSERMLPMTNGCFRAQLPSFSLLAGEYSLEMTLFAEPPHGAGPAGAVPPPATRLSWPGSDTWFCTTTSKVGRITVWR